MSDGVKGMSALVTGGANMEQSLVPLWHMDMVCSILNHKCSYPAEREALSALFPLVSIEGIDWLNACFPQLI